MTYIQIDKDLFNNIAVVQLVPVKYDDDEQGMYTTHYINENGVSLKIECENNPTTKRYFVAGE